MKNKQIVIQLHEGCMAPSDDYIEAAEHPDIATRVRNIKQYLRERLINEPDCLIIDEVKIIDCDCEAE